MKKEIILTPEALTELKRKALIENVGASCRLEGGKMTNEEVEELLFGTKTLSQDKN